MYLGLSIHFAKSSNEIPVGVTSPNLIDEMVAGTFKLDEQALLCEIDSNAVMTKFMTHILASTLILRVYGYFKYKN